MFDLRILAEAKFYSSEISKEKIREYIGTIKDISENYFIDDINTTENQIRYTDIGVFFAANGFQNQAENLAFAHGIKTISYKNNYIVEKIKPLIINLEKECLSIKCISKDNKNQFMRLLSELLTYPDDLLSEEFEKKFEPKPNYNRYINEIRIILGRIKTAFFGITETNFFIHFLGYESFPIELFKNTDECDVRIFFDEAVNSHGKNTKYFYLMINGSNKQFYFNVPESMIDSIFQNFIIDEKQRHFSKIKVSISPKIQRNLVFNLDKQWINKFKPIRKINMNLQ